MWRSALTRQAEQSDRLGAGRRARTSTTRAMVLEARTRKGLAYWARLEQRRCRSRWRRWDCHRRPVGAKSTRGPGSSRDVGSGAAAWGAAQAADKAVEEIGFRAGQIVGGWRWSRGREAVPARARPRRLIHNRRGTQEGAQGTGQVTRRACPRSRGLEKGHSLIFFAIGESVNLRCSLRAARGE